MSSSTNNIHDEKQKVVRLQNTFIGHLVKEMKNIQP